MKKRGRGQGIPRHLGDVHVPQILGNCFGTDESKKQDMEVVLKKSSNLVGSSVRAMFRVNAKKKCKYMFLSVKLGFFFFLFKDGSNLAFLGLPDLDETTLGLIGIY